MRAAVLLGLLALPPLTGQEAETALERLRRLVPRWRPVEWPAGQELILKPSDSLTVEDLRKVDLDEDPPLLSGPAPACSKQMADDCPPEARPYVARDIRPFRFRHFRCEFNYGGWHNFDMQDYAATHGFDILSPYVRKAEEVRHWPRGTAVLHWGGFVDWHKWLPDHGIPDGRYDRLAEMDLVKLHLESGAFRRDLASPSANRLAEFFMIDQEHPVLPPPKLREQPWYPRGAPEAERAAFEKKYYDGYAQTYVSSVRAARQSGWKNISIYGWYPYGRTWGGLEQADAEPGTDHAWNAFGKQVLDAVDIVNNSVYCFYWSPQNVAYTLANIDMNLEMVNSAPKPKPVRPYYWTLLHGGGGGWRWWRELPLADEETRAMIAMGFFTGFDGFDTWNWSGTGSHHTVSLASPVRRTVEGPDGKKKQVTELECHDVMVGREFKAKAEDGSEETFRRYDAIHVLSLDAAAGTARFQKIRPRAENHGVAPKFPSFTMPEAALKAVLRPRSEPVAAMIEGMALVKPLESLLRHGRPRIDVPAREQFGRTLPVVRRVKLGPWHVLITYDPGVIFGGPPREIALSDFDGVKGRTLRLPADAETRVFVVKER